MLRCQEYQSIDLFLQSIGEFLKRLGTPDFLEHTLPDPKLSTEAKIDEAIVALSAVGSLLLIIDNLESVQNDDQMIRDKGLLYLLQAFLTNLRGGRVLVTGRYTVKELLLQENLRTKFLHLSLDDLSRYETSQLLLRYPPLAQLSEIVRQMLVREFGGLPYVYHLLSSKAAVEDLEQIIYEVREYGAVKQKTITENHKQRTAERWQKVHSEIVEFATLEIIMSRLSEASRTLLAQLAILQQPFPLAAIEEGLGALPPVWQPLLDWSLLHYDSHDRSYHLHNFTRRYTEGMLEEQPRKLAQVQLANWYEHYANQDSHHLADYLEAHRLLRTAGRVQQAGLLVMQEAGTLRRHGLYPLLRDLCAKTLIDMHESDGPLTTNTLYEMGNLAYLQGKYEEARGLYLRSLEIEERLGNQSGRAISLYGLGNVAFAQGKHKEARDLYQQSLEIEERLENQSGRASTLHQLGMVAQNQGEYEGARDLYQQSLEIEERLGNQSGRASTLHQLGVIAQLQGEYEEARSLYQQSLEIFEWLKDQNERATTLHDLGTIAYLQGEYEEARSLYQQSLGIKEWLGDQRGRAGTIHQLGMIAQNQGEYEEARDLYQQSLEIEERLGNQSGRAGALHQLGRIAQNQGKYEEARDLYQQSLEIEERLGDQSGRAGALHQLGRIAQNQGKYEEARSLYQQSLEIFEQLGDQSGRANSLGQLGMLTYEQEDFESALIYTIQSYILFDALRSPSRAFALRMIDRIRSHIDEEAFIAHWQRLAGNRPLPTLSAESIQQLLLQVAVDFINTSTLDATKRFLESHLELLQPEVDVLLQELGMQQEQDSARKLIEWYRLLLAECRSRGIDGVFADIHAFQDIQSMQPSQQEKGNDG